MIETVQEIIRYFVSHGKAPSLSFLKVSDATLEERQGAVFVTLYNKGEVCGSAGNIKEIEENLLNELIASTVAALSTDKRFEPILSVEEAETLKVRIDEIVSKIVLVEEKELLKLEPKKVGTIVIKKDYEKMAVILPNISSNLHYGKDFPEALSNKLGEKFKFSDYIVYKLETKQYTNF